MKLPRSPSRRVLAGIASTETLLALPLVLLLGLSALQWGLVFQGRQAVAHAAIEAGRAGSVDHAASEAIERGLARGIAPWLYGASGPEDHASSIQRAQTHLQVGITSGWVAWRRLAPTEQSFADWAEPARDDRGLAIEGVLEIPNDNLTLRIGGRLPAGGVAGYRSGEPIGATSGQTLADANLLKVEVIYGVPLTVPLIGRVAAWIMRGVDGCGAQAASGGPTARSLRLGTLDPGSPAALGGGRAWTCPHYDAVDASGRSKPRWPVRVSATIRMQSPARSASAVPQMASGAQSGGSLGLGAVDDAQTFLPAPVDQFNPAGSGPTADGSVDRAPGFLRIGGDRLVEPPGVCAAAAT